MTENGPPGLVRAAEVLSLMPEDILAETCQNVVQYLSNKKGTVDINSLKSNCSAAGCDISIDDVECSTNGLLYVYRSALRDGITAEDMNKQLKTSSSWKANVIKTICQTWQQRHIQIMDKSSPNQLLGVGRLVDLQWKLGMATSSSLCRNLSSLFVTMAIKVADPSGNITSKSFEMTIPEFRNFYQQFSSISLDAV